MVYKKIVRPGMLGPIYVELRRDKHDYDLYLDDERHPDFIVLYDGSRYECFLQEPISGDEPSEASHK